MADQEQLDILRRGTTEWNAWRTQHPEISIDLRGADLSDASLSGANLSGTNLSGADLAFANFSSANFIGANLNGADLVAANLSRADFIGADLAITDLSDADLSGANLSRADLIGANFSRTNLSEANLSETLVAETIFSDLDLRQVKGLETINHEGPSTIGTDTLKRSQGDIPEVFLRGSGLSDTLITYARSLVQQPIQYYTCFISYSNKDQDFAERLYADLQNKGVRCWYAPKELKAGDYYRDKIEKSIRLYDKLLLILSQHSIKSQWVEDEVEKALAKEDAMDMTTQVLFPIRLDESIMQTKRSWASSVRFLRHILDFTGWRDHDAYQKAFQRLMHDLQQDAKQQMP